MSWRASKLIFPARIFVVSFAAVVALGILGGCKPVGPNYKLPEYTAPAAYKESGGPMTLVPPPAPKDGGWEKANPSDGMLRGKWWEIFNDPQLNQLEERIAPYNQSLKGSLEIYLAARDQIAVAHAALYPTLSAGPGFTHFKNSSNAPNSAPTSKTSYNDITLEGQAYWEPDFWGRIRRQIESAHANTQASAADMANVNLSLQAQMAVAYFQLRGLDAQSKMLEAMVVDEEHQLDLTLKRLAGGVATDVDVAQARTALETTRAQLVDVGVARAQYEHAIGTIAYYKLPDFTIPPSPLEGAPPKIPIGVPSQLLERRPDIAAAERRAAAANEQIGIAVSAFYPTITLGGIGGFESAHGGTWLQGPSALWSLGAQATELLFDAGQRHALTDQARHNYEFEVAAYKNIIFLGFQDVEDQLSTVRILETEAQAEEQAVQAAEHSYELSNTRYRGGVTGYLEVLIAESTLLTNKSTAIDVETRRFVASVGLIRSLGGGWDRTELPR